MQQPRSCGWAGVDVGKGHHWVCLIDEAGTTVWSAKVVNDEGAAPRTCTVPGGTHASCVGCSTSG